METFEFHNKIKRCPHCRNYLNTRKCGAALENLYIYCYNCDYSLVENTDGKEFVKKKSKSEKNEQVDKNYKTYIIQLLLLCLVVVYAIVLASNFFVKKNDENGILQGIRNLKKNYPSQKNETWFHIQSVFNMSVPSVKSIILLHDQDTRTSNCLRQELVSLYTRDQNVNIEDITYHNGDKFRDYGEALEYYKPLIQKYGIFVTNLQEVSGNIARIFHSLCDDISSDIKPSIFIFTLQYDKSLRNLMPLQRASKILRTAWREVAENEIWPLLARIARNVVEIIPEKNIPC